MIFCFTYVSKINCKVWKKKIFLCWYLHIPILMEFYEDILFHIIVVAQNCIEKYLLCETSCTSFFLSYHLLFFFYYWNNIHLYVYVWDIFWKKYQAKYIPAIQRQTFSRYIEICHLEYVCILCSNFESEIQETFKFNFDDIYFWLDS